MLPRSLLFLQLCLYPIVYGGGVYQAEIVDKCGINVNIGTPAQNFLVFLSPTADELIVSDARCGLVSNNCPKYCDDSGFSELYCNVSCWSITTQERQLHCEQNTKEMYYLNRSSTYRPSVDNLNRPFEWKANYKNLRAFHGVFSLDVIEFQGRQIDKSLPDNFTMLNGRFVSGMMLDTRIFTNFNGIFGLAPPLKGAHLLIQATQNNNINAPILTIDGNSKLVTFGAPDNSNCKNWTSIEPLTSNQWVFTANGIELMDKNVDGLNTIMIDPCLNAIAAPTRIINNLLGDGVIFERNVTNVAVTHPFVAACDTAITLKLTFGADEYSMDNLILKPMIIIDDKCVVGLSRAEDYRFKDTPEWILGIPFTKQFCHSYDYQSISIGIGKPAI